MQPDAPPPCRVAIIGDVGGHHDDLARILVGLGCDPDAGTIPDGLHVVQVGDLIHRGPASDQVVALVDRFHRASPDRWTQLTGNHESQYLRAPAFTWPEHVDDATVATLRSWWHDGWLRMASALTTTGQEVRAPGGGRVRVGSGGLLLTHAGLTAGRWSALGRPASALEAAAAIEADARGRDEQDWTGVWSPGVMLTRAPSTSAGVVWAASDSELARSWVQHATRGPLPGFHQAHGHSRPLWRSKAGTRWSPVITQIPREALARRVDTDTATSRLLVLPQQDASAADLLAGAMALWGTDPGNGKQAADVWGALELTCP